MKVSEKEQQLTDLKVSKNWSTTYHFLSIWIETISLHSSARLKHTNKMAQGRRH
jgi:hypothetical protein